MMDSQESFILRVRQTFRQYPAQFELMFWGMLISTAGASMIWPFLMVYVSERVDAPLTTIASLLTLNSAMGLAASFVGGPLMDRLGRKWIMVGSLAVNGLAYLFMGQAQTLPQFAVLMSITGAANPLYRVGADAMMADLVPAPKRVDAYALMRLSNNLGISIGPVIGGWMAAGTVGLAFYFAAAGMMTYSLLLATRAHETLPTLVKKSISPDSDQTTGAQAASTPPRERFGGYFTILKDTTFISFIVTFTLVSVCATLIWVLLPVYATQTMSVPKSLYGWIPTTNALMVVFLQLPTTRRTKRYPELLVMATGAFFYTLAVGSIALGHSFPAFWLSMVIMTIGELILVPTSSTFVANLAPADKRGRYMGLYGITWGVAAGIGPVFGGLLNDRLGPTAIWYGGALAGLTSVTAFLLMYRKAKTSPQPNAVPAATSD